MPTPRTTKSEVRSTTAPSHRAGGLLCHSELAAWGQPFALRLSKDTGGWREPALSGGGVGGGHEGNLSAPQRAATSRTLTHATPSVEIERRPFPLVLRFSQACPERGR